MLNIGVIGAGHLGAIHIKLLSQNKSINLIGIYDTDVFKAKEIANIYNIISFDSQIDLIKNCDCLIIASPTIFHHSIAKECLLQGKHCFIEKPITDTYSNALELIQIAKDKNLILQVGHVERFNPVMAVLDKYEISPLFIEGHRLSQFKPRSLDVSVVHDLMIHDIDICLMLTKSKIKKIEANGVSVLTNSTDIANARIHFNNGAVANLTASRISAKPMRKLRIFQKSAYFSLDFEKQDVKIFGLTENNINPNNINPENEKIQNSIILGTIELDSINKNIIMENPTVPNINAIEQEHYSFINSIVNNSPAKVNGDEAAEALRIVEIINDLIIEQKI